MLKLREKLYTSIEQQPDRADDIKKSLILSNVYSMRMNVDVAFKREMYKRLDENLRGNFTKDNFKNLIVSIIDELERPSERFLNIFAQESIEKVSIPTEPIGEYLHLILSKRPLQDFEDYYKGKGSSVIFLKKLLESTEKGTTLHRALEDLIEEYQMGIFFPRYFKPGEIRSYIMYHFNYYRILLLEHRLEDLGGGLALSLTLLKSQ